MDAGDIFRERLSLALAEKGMTVADLAKVSGVRDSTIRQIIKRDRSSPRLDIAAKLATALGTTLSDMTAEGPSPSSLARGLERLQPHERALFLKVLQALGESPAEEPR